MDRRVYVDARCCLGWRHVWAPQAMASALGRRGKLIGPPLTRLKIGLRRE